MINPARKKWIALASLGSALLLAVMLVPASAQHDADAAPVKQLEMMSKMLGLVNDLSKVVESPSATGVFAVMGLDESIKDPAAQAKFLERVLPDVKDPAVQRFIRQKLADNYKKTGQHEKALAEIERLITGKVGG